MGGTSPPMPGAPCEHREISRRRRVPAPAARIRRRRPDGTEGTVINHVGFIVPNVQDAVAKWKAAGVAVLPGNNGRLDQALSRRRTVCASKSWRTRTRPYRSSTTTSISSCRRRRSGHPGLVRHELRCAGRHARAQPVRRHSWRQPDIHQVRHADRSDLRTDPRPHRLRRGEHRRDSARSFRPTE